MTTTADEVKTCGIAYSVPAHERMIDKQLVYRCALPARHEGEHRKAEVQAEPTAIDQAMLSGAVAGLERRCKVLDELCGSMLATLKVNRERGSISTADDEHFDMLVKGWTERYKFISGGA